MSRRRAIRILNFIFAEMSKALSRGRAVEFPMGTLVRMKKEYGQMWEMHGDIPAGRQEYTGAWHLNEAGTERVWGRMQAPECGPGRGRRKK